MKSNNLYEWINWHGSELSTLQTDVYVCVECRRLALCTLSGACQKKRSKEEEAERLYWYSMTFLCYFPWLCTVSRSEKGLTKYHDFPWSMKHVFVIPATATTNMVRSHYLWQWWRGGVIRSTKQTYTAFAPFNHPMNNIPVLFYMTYPHILYSKPLASNNTSHQSLYFSHLWNTLPFHFYSSPNMIHCYAMWLTSMEWSGCYIHCVQKKNTHSHFLPYLHEWCVDLNKNCSEYT